MSQTRRRAGKNEVPRDVKQPSAQSKQTSAVGNDSGVEVTVAGALIDYSFMLSLVLGGCCTNVWAYEQLLRMEPRIGSALTFSQMLFITLHQLPSFTTWSRPDSLVPKLRPRTVPLTQWLLQVVVLASGSLLNNWVFAFSVPLTIQIVFRSAGLAVSMLFGHLIMKQRYSLLQTVAVALVSVGVVIATLSRPSSNMTATGDVSRYAIGVLMLIASLVCTGLLGMLQERTYRTYGPCWKEGVFYTHALSLPIFVFMIPQVKYGLSSLYQASDSRLPIPYIVLALNLLSQLICVTGVNQLSSRVSSVSTQVVLTTRKAISLCFSVWWFGSGWNAQLAVGASMVFAGSFWYSLISSKPREKSSKSA